MGHIVEMYPLDFEEFLRANGMSTGVIDKAEVLTYNRNYNMNIFSLFKKKGESGLTYSELETWLNEVMQMTIPVDVVAFCFNLYEDVNKSWTLELIGANTFVATDSDWACDEVFTTRDNPLIWNENKEWQDVLMKIKELLQDYLEKGKYGKVLKEGQGLAVGFIDGDLTLL